MHNTNRQRGGTILGIIIGLVIGLGIALAVAIVITKTPTPFTNKLARPEKAPESSAAQSGDPNKPLYGNRAAARDAAKDLVKPAEPATAAAPANTAAPTAENKAPVIELSNNADKPKKADAADDDKWSYYLQAGAFRERADADSLRGKLALMGVEARVSERQSENGPLYRVRVGPFSQLDAMTRARTKLSDNGVDAAVVRTSKQ